MKQSELRKLIRQEVKNVVNEQKLNEDVGIGMQLLSALAGLIAGGAITTYIAGSSPAKMAKMISDDAKAWMLVRKLRQDPEIEASLSGNKKQLLAAVQAKMKTLSPGELATLERVINLKTGALKAAFFSHPSDYLPGNM